VLISRFSIFPPKSNYEIPHYATFSIPWPNILLSNLFSNILTERYFCNARNQVSYPGKIISAMQSSVRKNGRFNGLYLLVYCTYNTRHSVYYSSASTNKIYGLQKKRDFSITTGSVSLATLSTADMTFASNSLDPSTGHVGCTGQSGTIFSGTSLSPENSNSLIIPSSKLYSIVKYQHKDTFTKIKYELLRVDPCGGVVEYLHRDPASRRRRRKGKSQN
jgi:hypothetical protein